MSTSKAENTVRIFVYGTLRKGGVAAHFLQKYLLIARAVPLKGFALYDGGWYPFAVPVEGNQEIIGDIFEIPLSALSELDEYEGPEYRRVFLEGPEFLIYLRKDRSTVSLKQVPEGDWLVYWETKNS